MLKWFYISRVTRFRMILFFFVSLYFGTWWFVFLLIIAYSVFLFLLYRKQLDFTSRRALDDNLILSPVSGDLFDIDRSDSEKIVLSIKIGLFDDYGILMPFYGEVVNYQKSEDKTEEFQVSSKKIPSTTVKLNKSLFQPKIFVRAGDKASSGVYLGYKPFGGIIEIEIPGNCEVLVEKGDEIQSAQTILASI